jgi:hypothetical protein
MRTSKNTKKIAKERLKNVPLQKKYMAVGAILQ